MHNTVDKWKKGKSMTLDELLTLRKQSDMLRIRRNGRDVYVGYIAMMKYHMEDVKELMAEQVKAYVPTLEFKHRDWKKKGLASPLQPDELPDYACKDLQTTIYHTIDM